MNRSRQITQFCIIQSSKAFVFTSSTHFFGTIEGTSCDSTISYQFGYTNSTFKCVRDIPTASELQRPPVHYVCVWAELIRSEFELFFNGFDFFGLLTFYHIFCLSAGNRIVFLIRLFMNLIGSYLFVFENRFKVKLLSGE